jgi:hypothetical protein
VFTNVSFTLKQIVSTHTGYYPDTGIYELGPNAGSALPYFGANFWLDKEIPVHVQFFEDNHYLKASILQEYQYDSRRFQLRASYSKNGPMAVLRTPE